MKNICIETKRDLKTFELNYFDNVLCNPEIYKVIKIYESKKGNFNYILVSSGKDSFFISMPKTDKNCSPSLFGGIQHAEKYNTFINI